MPMHRDTKKTELMSGPSTSARTHPNVFLAVLRFEIFKQKKKRLK